MPGSPPVAAVPSSPAKRLVIRDAATLVLVDRAASAPRILMGRRRADLAFLANKFVFPGGRVDKADRTAPCQIPLAAAVCDKLLVGMRGRPNAARAHALAIAAIRETREEAGLVIGAPDRPDLSAISFFARAITPPGRPRRYDTRFFVADASAISTRAHDGDGELVDLSWFTLPEIRALDLPGITRLVIEDVSELLAHDGASAPGDRPIPFYYHRRGRFQRDLI
jgi:8-oxo-dGTP pyrophosphatase MutT (NUDIX family)